MKRRHVVSWVLGVPVVVLAMALLAVLAMPDWLDRMLARQVNAYMSGVLSFDLSTRFLGRAPVIEATRVRWRAPDGLPGRIDVDRAVVRTTWAAGPDEARWLDVTLVGGDIALYQRADGGWRYPEWMAAGHTDTGTSETAVRLRSVTVKNVSLLLVPQAAPPIMLRVADAMLDASPPGWTAQATVEARREALVVDGQVRAGVSLADDLVAFSHVHFEGLVAQSGGVLQIPELNVRAVRLGTDRLVIESLAGRVRGSPLADLGELNAAFTVPVIEGAVDRWSARVARIEAGLRGPDPVSIVVGECEISGSGSAIRLAPMVGQLEVTLPTGVVSLQTRQGALDYAVDEARLTLAALAWDAQVPDPATPGAHVDVSGGVSGTWSGRNRRAQFAVDLHAAESNANGTLTYDPRAHPPLTLEAAVDRLNLDRWTPPSKADTRSGVPLDVWRNWPMQLDLSVGQLTFQGVRVKGAEVRLGEPK